MSAIEIYRHLNSHYIVWELPTIHGRTAASAV